MKKTTLYLILIGGMLVGLEAKAPNILFIISDDQAPDTIAALGNAEIHTPNLDRLVKGGTSFTHCFRVIFI